MVVDVAPVGLVRRGANFDPGVVLEPLIHPNAHRVLPRLGHVQAPGFLDGRLQLGLRLCLGPAQDVFVDGFARLRIVPGGVAPLPPAILPFSDVALTVGPFLSHSIRLLCNDTTYHRKKK